MDQRSKPPIACLPTIHGAQRHRAKKSEPSQAEKSKPLIYRRLPGGRDGARTRDRRRTGRNLVEKSIGRDPFERGKKVASVTRPLETSPVTGKPPRIMSFLRPTGDWSPVMIQLTPEIAVPEMGCPSEKAPDNVLVSSRFGVDARWCAARVEAVRLMARSRSWATP